jgi:hypothetical protein
MEITKTLTILAVFLVTANAAFGQGAETKLSLDSSKSLVQVEFVRHDRSAQETIRIKDGSEWRLALSAPGSVTHVRAGDPATLQTCTIQSSERMQAPARLVLRWDCGVGSLERTLALNEEPDVILVTVRFAPKPGASIHSVEDRYDFAPERRSTDTFTEGPLDFVWSQNLKREPGDLVPYWSFKSTVTSIALPKFAERSSAIVTTSASGTNRKKTRGSTPGFRPCALPTAGTSTASI